jgi:UTP--glucose-1-phosphate uridylyltransferase
MHDAGQWPQAAGVAQAGYRVLNVDKRGHGRSGLHRARYTMWDLADDLIRADPPALKQMMDVYNHYNSSVLAVQDVPRNQTNQYGVVKGRLWEKGIHKLEGIVEKPRPEEAPSTLGVVGRYILTSRIFDHLQVIQAGSGGEIQLTDAIARLLLKEQVLAYAFQGKRFDCGSKMGYLEATVEYALTHPELNVDFRSYIKNLKLAE